MRTDWIAGWVVIRSPSDRSFTDAQQTSWMTKRITVLAWSTSTRYSTELTVSSTSLHNSVNHTTFILRIGLVKVYSAPGRRLWNSLPTVPNSRFKKRLADKWITTDHDMKQAVNSSLQTRDQDLLYSAIQNLVARWDRCLDFKVWNPLSACSICNERNVTRQFTTLLQG
jgi:hypothetical protein